MARTIGKVWVRVVPDTSSFTDDVKKALRKTEKQAKAKIKVEPELQKGALKAIKEQIQGVKAKIKATVELDVDQAKLVAKVQAAVKEARTRRPLSIRRWTWTGSPWRRL